MNLSGTSFARTSHCHNRKAGRIFVSAGSPKQTVFFCANAQLANTLLMAPVNQELSASTDTFERKPGHL